MLIFLQQCHNLNIKYRSEQEGIVSQPQWTVAADGDATPITITLAGTRVTVATENGEQITLAPEQLEPLVHRLDAIAYDLRFPAG